MWTTLPLALAVDLSVGPAQPYPTVSDALDDAVSGDRILVEPGEYDERALDIGGRTLTMEATAPGALIRGSGRRILLIGAGGALTVVGLSFDGDDDRGLAEVQGGELHLVGVTAVAMGTPINGQPGGSLDLTDAFVTIDASALEGAITS